MNPVFANPPNPAASMFDDLPDGPYAIRAEAVKARHEVVRELARVTAENTRLRTDADLLAGMLADAIGRLEQYEQWSSTQTNRELLGLWRAALAAHNTQSGKRREIA